MLRMSNWRLSADMKHVLIETDRVKVCYLLHRRSTCTDYAKQWRWSGWGNYYIHTLADGTTRALIPPSNPPTISYAAWSPVGNALAFVSSNDLYVITDPSYVSQ